MAMTDYDISQAAKVMYWTHAEDDADFLKNYPEEYHAAIIAECERITRVEDKANDIYKREREI